MKHLILFALLMPLALSMKPGLRAKFNIGLRPGKDFFYDVPRTVAAAEKAGWTLLERPPGPLPTLILYCATERVIGVLFDPNTGEVAGMQVALPLSDYSDAVFDWKTQGYVDWTPTPAAGEDTITYKTKQIYFVSEDSLKTPKNEIENVSRTADVLTEGAVWVTGFHGELVKISSKLSDIKKSVFTKQACIPWMGRHYYYNMTIETECTADSLFNWFPLINDGKLIGLGFLSFGKIKVHKNKRLWFEQPTKAAVKAIVPDGPECLYKLAEDPTVTTMHIYFVDKPWWITCIFQ